MEAQGDSSAGTNADAIRYHSSNANAIDMPVLYSVSPKTMYDNGIIQAKRLIARDCLVIHGTNASDGVHTQ